MPYTTRKLKGGKVSVSSPNGIKAKSTTPEKAAAQERLLRAIEHNPNFKPRNKKK
jgi:hypothetical protein